MIVSRLRRSMLRRGMLSRRRCCCGGTSICLSACGGPLFGATIQIRTGATVVATGTTNATGCCSFTQSGTFDVRSVVGGTTHDFGNRTLAGTTINLGQPTGTGQPISCCTSYNVPVNLTLTSSLGTTAFVQGAGQTWRGSLIYHPAGNIVTDLCTAFVGTCSYAAIGTGSVRVDYEGFCTDTIDPTHETYPSGYFLVRARWVTTAYNSTPAFEDTACAAGGTPKTWYPQFCEANGTTTTDVCTYLDTGSGNFNVFVDNAVAELMAVPSSDAPFTWSGSLDPSVDPTDNCVVPDGLDVTISA